MYGFLYNQTAEWNVVKGKSSVLVHSVEMLTKISNSDTGIADRSINNIQTASDTSRGFDEQKKLQWY